MKLSEKPVPAVLILIITAFLAGMANGLFGMGGGIVVFFLLRHIYADDPAVSTKDVFASTVLCVLIMSLSSVFLYCRDGYVSFRDAVPFLVPAVLGGIAGAFLLDKLDTKWLKKIFAVLMAYGGLSLIFRK